MNSDPSSADAGFTAYSAFIKTELEAQKERKASLEQRALNVITTSGVLVSLLFGLAAVITSQEGFVLSDRARDWLAGALFFFVGAALAALVVNAPLRYRYVRADDLVKGLNERWGDSLRSAERTVARTRVDLYRVHLAKNQLKGKILLGAMGAEVVGIACLAYAVLVVMAD
jgi:hypothetical protein